MTRAVILGTGSCLPRRVLTNAELEKMVETSDEWIAVRTGIRERRISGAGEETSQLAAEAARRAMAMAGIAAGEIGLIIVGTMTCEKAMPSCACLVQKHIGAGNAFAMDINAACSGFLYGMDVAEKYIKADPALKVLVIGAETLSTRTNWEDRTTCVLFGDGAGAVVMTGGEGERGMLASRLFADGSLWHLLHMDAAPSLNPDLVAADYQGPFIRMAGQEVFKYAVRAMQDGVAKVLAQENIASESVRLVIPHQANIRILNSLTDRLGIGAEKIYINVHKYGNTSAASMPIALDEANREGRLQPGDPVLFCAFGGGFTWGAAVMRW